MHFNDIAGVMRDTILTLCRTPRAILAAMLLVAASMLGGCAGGGAAGDSFAMASGSGPTIAFESIDGPPPQAPQKASPVSARN